MPSFSEQVGIDDSRTLLTWLGAFTDWYGAVAQAEAWLLDLYRLLLGVVASERPVRMGLQQLCTEWADLVRAGRDYTLRGITIPDAFPGSVPFDAAVNALASGRKPFGLFSIRKSKLKAALEEVRIDGHPPESNQDWLQISEYRAWQRNVDIFIKKWTSAARAVSLPTLPDEWEEGHQKFERIGKFIELLLNFRTEANANIAKIAAIFPYGVDAKRVVYYGETTLICEALTAAVQREDNVAAHATMRRLEALPHNASLPFWSALDEFRSAAGRQDVSPRQIACSWREILQEVNRLAALRPYRLRLETIASVITASGAPMWASSLLSEPSLGEEDRWTPSDWHEAWEWARAAGSLRRISDRSQAGRLSAKRSALEDERHRLLAEIVRLRTFIGLRRHITTSIASALAKFAMAIRQLGQGTGKAAERHRRAIREAVLQASVAVPCWIMPEWRVAEQLPSELATFDLVIVDEASQSDITALPAVMRGRKLLVVGDDRQVSPISVGTEERTVIQLRETFLRGMPLANYLDPSTSLYDIGSMMFPGTTVMLREHFRCVEPIIRFSSRLCYEDKGGLVPLRLPTESERINPPLVDVFIKAGHKYGDINKAEAEFIVQEIERIVGDPTFASRTIGVISLIGDKQAKYISDLLSARLGLESIEQRRIMCGNAYTFQGQERDIIFLSMVTCPSTVRVQTARMYQQRFNVAMSRARDRVYLVRSVASSMLAPKDLKLAILEHFKNPMGDVISPQPTDVLQRCESPFEREVGERLLGLGYRLRPQVAVGQYRIDFVVEGLGDRRLAIELDGDSYHGPEKWVDDLRRQRALERMGWKFWRCWGSRWRTDQDGCLDDLLSTLAGMEIEPLRGEYSPAAFTELRVIGGDETAPTTKTEGGISVSDNFREEPSADGETSACARSGKASVTGRVLIGSPHVTPSPTTPVATAAHPSELVVELGDTVVVRFGDNRIRRLRLSNDMRDRGDGTVGSTQPLGAALLGRGLDEEAEFTVDGKHRVAVIEKIFKSREFRLTG